MVVDVAAAAADLERRRRTRHGVRSAAVQRKRTTRRRARQSPVSANASGYNHQPIATTIVCVVQVRESSSPSSCRFRLNAVCYSETPSGRPVRKSCRFCEFSTSRNPASGLYPPPTRHNEQQRVASVSPPPRLRSELDFSLILCTI
ncbi:unnamed protein product [Aphis gossypii]|uniref:Uncharacterized protein n=1 Tax=Aphis gossypii TaxID=80765 RepID=A0A9P0J4Q3_APHGO|nr:unnamed protein product [Aphis gossypii]